LPDFISFTEAEAAASCTDMRLNSLCSGGTIDANVDPGTVFQIANGKSCVFRGKGACANTPRACADVALDDFVSKAAFDAACNSLNTGKVPLCFPAKAGAPLLRECKAVLGLGAFYAPPVRCADIDLEKFMTAQTTGGYSGAWENLAAFCGSNASLTDGLAGTLPEETAGTSCGWNPYVEHCTSLDDGAQRAALEDCNVVQDPALCPNDADRFLVVGIDGATKVCRQNNAYNPLADFDQNTNAPCENAPEGHEATVGCKAKDVIYLQSLLDAAEVCGQFSVDAGNAGDVNCNGDRVLVQQDSYTTTEGLGNRAICQEDVMNNTRCVGTVDEGFADIAAGNKLCGQSRADLAKEWANDSGKLVLAITANICESISVPVAEVVNGANGIILSGFCEVQ
jgi:hypothetical protein